MGRAAAQAFAREGAKLVLGARRQDEGEALAAALRSEGADAVFVATDVNREQDIEALVQLALARHGRLDVAFNNAGTEGSKAELAEQDNDNYDLVMDTNVRGVFWAMKHEIRAMLQSGGGAIVNNASMGSEIGFPNLALYIASKHAVAGLVKTAALELGSSNVRVNAVAPGPIDNRMTHSLADQLSPGDEKGFRSFVEGKIPMGRYGTNEEIAHLIAFLASDAATYCSGGLYLADGGYVAG